MVVGLHKEELILIHLTLWNIKQMLEGAGYHNFDDYERLGVLPPHIHRSKADHRRAINRLAREIECTLNGDLHINLMDSAVETELENVNDLLKHVEIPG